MPSLILALLALACVAPSTWAHLNVSPKQYAIGVPYHTVPFVCPLKLSVSVESSRLDTGVLGCEFSYQGRRQRCFFDNVSGGLMAHIGDYETCQALRVTQATPRSNDEHCTPTCAKSRADGSQLLGMRHNTREESLTCTYKDASSPCVYNTDTLMGSSRESNPSECHAVRNDCSGALGKRYRGDDNYTAMLKRWSERGSQPVARTKPGNVPSWGRRRTPRGVEEVL